MKKNKPYLTLVGAGPGDPELFTLKGVKALSTADVVLYDALVNKDLLDYAPAKSQKVFVGKRAGKHSLKQEEINELIVEYAFNYGHVVRLKGGDPFVFGRGHEEIAYAAAFGIDSSVVPGISSSIAVPELQKIPVTARGYSESFWVVTGTTKEGELSKDIHLAAQSTATVVVLMGLGKLAEIIKPFAEFRGADTPIAVIHAGTTKNEKTAIGTLDNIEAMVNDKQITTPALILIGEVVNVHPEMVERIIEREFRNA